MKKLFLLSFLLIFISSFLKLSYATNEQVPAILNKKISIVFNNELKSFSDVNGNTVYPVLYNGTTYLPVRAISGLFDIGVQWIGEENKIYLGKGEVDNNTAKSIDNFEAGDNVDVLPQLNKEIKIEYKERLQKFSDVNGNVVYPLSYEGTTYLPVRAISNMYGATIDWNGANSRITIARENKLATITSVTIKVIDGVTCAAVTTDNPLYDYKYYSLNDPNRIIVDLQNSTFGISKDSKSINYGTLNSVRLGDQGNNLSRVVLDVSDIGTYSVVQSSDRKTTYLALKEDFELKDNKEDPTSVLVASIGNAIYLPPIDNEKPSDNVTTVPSGDDENKSDEVTVPSGEANVSGEVTTPSVDANASGEVAVPSGDLNASGEDMSDDEKVYGGDDDEDSEKSDISEANGEKNNEDDELSKVDLEKMARIKSVTYSSSTNKIKVNLTGKFTYKKFLLSNPSRIVVDIDNAYLDVDGPTEIKPKNKNIKEIRFSQNEKDIVRVVVELLNDAEYKVTEKSDCLEILVEEPAYKNIKYELGDEEATLTLYNVKEKVFDATETAKSNKYALTYSSSKFSSGKGTIEINDEFVNKIEIKTNKITITTPERMKYSMKQDGDNVVLTISNRSSSNENDEKDNFIVLIDAGHGGSDPGACNGAEYEKKYNLAIALKLYELLKETDGITVYISRDDDTYINQQGRLDFANSHDADLYVSVHNNSATNKNYNGTMVLYYNKECEKDFGITSKEFAEIVLDELVDNLGTKNLGVVVRDDLWVLYRSRLPAILCEVSFISNDSELERLKTDKFQQNAADAIYNGVLAAKKQMGR